VCDCVTVLWLICSDFYEPGAMLLEEEAQVIAGLLVGLNVIDCNMGIKDEDLDKPVGHIDFINVSVVGLICS